MVNEQTGHVVSVNLSEKKGTIKRSVPSVTVDGRGVVGDAHAGPWHRQVSLLSAELIETFSAAHGRRLQPGEFAENITTSGLAFSALGILDLLCVGEARMQVSQVGKECHGDQCAIFREVGACVMPKEGIFCRVLEGGVIKPGDDVRHTPRPLRFQVITVSDRASAGEYSDRSGPAVAEAIEGFFSGKRWHPRTERTVVPDDADRIRGALSTARDAGVDVVLTTGGTGVGPRDVTPDVARTVIDREIPGIMEHIRVTFGREKPNALLSRGVAGVTGTTLVYTLPGSVRAVREYMGEICKTIEHLIVTVHGLDLH